MQHPKDVHPEATSHDRADTPNCHVPPISHVSGALQRVRKRTHLVTFRENYQPPAAQRAAQRRRILKYLVASRFSHRQGIHSLQLCGLNEQSDFSVEEQATGLDKPLAEASQVSTTCGTGASMTRTSNSRPHQRRGVLDYINNICTFQPQYERIDDLASQIYYL